MKKIIIALSFILFAQLTSAQDLIITQDGDSINCQITKIKKDFIYFRFINDGEAQNSLIPNEEVKTYINDYDTEVQIPKVDPLKSPSLIKKDNYRKFRIGGYGGYSYQLARVSSSVPPDFKDYVKKLKSGYHYGADATYFISENTGLGIKYTMFRSKNSMDNIYITYDNGDTEYGRMSDDLFISFVGPNLVYRKFDKYNTNCFYMQGALGYMSYKNNKEVVSPFVMTGSTLGSCIDIGYEISIDNNLFLGFQLSLMAGTLSKYTIDDGESSETFELEDDEYENLTRVDLSICLRFCK
ncbi:hypothetical protein E9993_16560 [Labilibacter sediminis]|nr:hypothetical protein E9993_16560 [Labilibacter sediminis]